MFFVAWQQAKGRQIGDVLPGAPELRAESPYNQDAQIIAGKFGIGLDVLTVLVETSTEDVAAPAVLDYLDRLGWRVGNTPGVLSVVSAPQLIRLTNEGLNEGNPRWAFLPGNETSINQALRSIPEVNSVLNESAALLQVHIYTADHKAETINRVVAAVRAFTADEPPPAGVRVRLAGGNLGLTAAVNDIVEHSELPMMLYVYGCILVLVAVMYRDWRAMICCCTPLTVATFLGYWLMKELHIGLKVATLPVMVLAVGIGVDYAFYIYNRLQHHLAEGLEISLAFQRALEEVGNATIFTAITLAVGVATWIFSGLKFQADMGLLLTFMFLANMIMAMTALPALAVVLERLFPRKIIRKVSWAH